MEAEKAGGNEAGGAAAEILAAATVAVLAMEKAAVEAMATEGDARCNMFAQSTDASCILRPGRVKFEMWLFVPNAAGAHIHVVIQ